MSRFPYTEFMKRLVEKTPGFAQRYQRHVEVNHGVLAYVLLGDLARWLVHQVEHALSHKESWARVEEMLDDVLSYMESEWQHSEGLRELISVSFLENLDLDSPSYPWFRSKMGPSMRTQMKVIEDAYRYPSVSHETEHKGG